MQPISPPGSAAARASWQPHGKEEPGQVQKWAQTAKEHYAQCGARCQEELTKVSRWPAAQRLE